MKYQELKKRLLAESGVVAAIIAVLGTGIFFLGSFSDDYEKDRQGLESKVSDIAANTNALRSKYDKVKQNNALYNKIVQLQSEDGLTITQQVAKNRFNRFRDQYYLNNLHLNMAPIVEMTGANYRRGAEVIISSEVSLDFDGLSDEYAYNLLNAVQQDLPGSSKISSLTLTRQGKITEEALRAISENGAYPLVKADIKFIWFGIKSVESNDNSANAAKNKQ